MWFYQKLAAPWGDIESLPYLEAIRQLRYEMGHRNTITAHLTLVPYLAAAGELKTKPTQHSVKTLLSYGLQPDLLVCRADRALDSELRRKIALFCNVEPRAVIEAIDAKSIYEVPLQLAKQGVQKLVMERMGIAGPTAHKHVTAEPDLTFWRRFIKRLKKPSKTVPIALVGKYVAHQDAYKSISESFILSGAELGVRVDVKYVLSDDLHSDHIESTLGDIAGILVGPGFGKRGIDGKIVAAGYARVNRIPFFGICLGLQCAIVEFARNVCGLTDAHSTEFNTDTPWPVIDLMEEQKTISDMGGTMRLGEYECQLLPGSRAHEIYGTTDVRERHRHRYEVNNDLLHHLSRSGLAFTEKNPSRNLVEIIELPSHPWFVGVQFHPEYRSTVGRPHPLFKSFVKACLKYQDIDMASM